MDDKTPRTPAWLAFTTAFDASARHCDYLRREGYTPEQIGQLIADYLDGKTAALGKALAPELPASDLILMGEIKLQQKICSALNWAQAEPDHHLLSLDHPRYPTRLYDTACPPPLLYAKGDLTALEYPAVAIVGSRKASRQAIELTRTLASELAASGVTVISGLARGIDAAAHEGALAAGGRTIAVAATEPESVYPKAHAGLERRIIRNRGLVVTEYPLGSPTLRWYFPRRNRIISGLSMGVLIAEAALPSGTLTTATHAANQGREVMAIPGSVHNAQAKGCHFLIKQGASLVECKQDILDVLGLPSTNPTAAKSLCTEASDNEMSNQKPLPLETPDVWETQLMEILAVAPTSIDELMTHMNCGIAELSARLGLMEIDGKIHTDSGGRYTRC